MIETNSHRAARDTLLAMGNLFFSGKHTLPKIRLRLNGLIVGPTGAGKSFLAESVARQLGAKYFRVTRGDWLPTGCRDKRSTAFQVLDQVLSYDRVVLHLDELDKFSNLQGEWSASIGADLWNILDKKFQITEYLRETTFKEGEKITEQDVARRVRLGLWILGSGTWQDVFANSRGRPSIGFGCGRAEASDVGFAEIVRSNEISPELLLRFSEPVFLHYPTEEETSQLLDSTGISALASQVGVRISPEQLDWNLGGMRVLENLATRLVIELYKSKQPTGPVCPTSNDADSKVEQSPY
jgi:SpoVK/Ycf46/Vps4 family AAA+-type ATPase